MLHLFVFLFQLGSDCPKGRTDLIWVLFLYKASYWRKRYKSGSPEMVHMDYIQRGAGVVSVFTQ